MKQSRIYEMALAHLCKSCLQNVVCCLFQPPMWLRWCGAKTALIGMPGATAPREGAKAPETDYSTNTQTGLTFAVTEKGRIRNERNNFKPFQFRQKPSAEVDQKKGAKMTTEELIKALREKESRDNRKLLDEAADQLELAVKAIIALTEELMALKAEKQLNGGATNGGK